MKIFKDLTVVTIGMMATALGTLGSIFPVQALTLSTSSGQVGSVDVATGVFTSFINNSPVFFTDIAVNDNGQLFGTTFSQLYSINQSPSSVTFIGDVNLDDINALGFANNNVLYATGVNSGFYSINASTSAATLISDISGNQSAGDIVFDPTINQFLATFTTPTDSTLFSIALNGIATQIGSVGFSSVFGLGFDRGTLYGYTIDGKQLIINSKTGVGVFDKNVTGLSGFQIFGAASSISEVQPVPEPMTLAGIVAVSFMAWGMKRKQKTSQSA
jgi:hypothetical protein